MLVLPIRFFFLFVCSNAFHHQTMVLFLLIIWPLPFSLLYKSQTNTGRNSRNLDNPIITAPPQSSVSPEPSVLARNLFESLFMSIEYLVHALLSKLMVFYRMCVFVRMQYTVQRRKGNLKQEQSIWVGFFFVSFFLPPALNRYPGVYVTFP